MSCRLLLLLPLLVNTAPATYTVHLLYYKHNSQSEAALAELLAQLCSAFTCGEQGGQLDSVTVWGDTLVTVPAALLGTVLPWLLQHRDGRVAGPPDTQVQQALPGCAPLFAAVAQPGPGAAPGHGAGAGLGLGAVHCLGRPPPPTRHKQTLCRTSSWHGRTQF